MRKKIAPVPKEDLPQWTCSNCWYFETQDADSGLCFGLPPGMANSDETWGFARPLVDPNDRGCSLFKPRHTA